MSIKSKIQGLINTINAKTGATDADLTSAVNRVCAMGDDGSFKAVIERTAVNPTLPSDLTSIGDHAFYNYSNLILPSLPNGLTSIGSSAFSSCSNLALTSLPSGITSIGTYAFQSCSNLALTSLPSGLTSVGNYAFRNCTSLTTVTFNGKPRSIPNNVFLGCTNLTTINVPWSQGEVTNAPWGATNATINYNYTGE